jgi:squalene-hopene/tetraprenyl-beta-curcumene cyclase
VLAGLVFAGEDPQQDYIQRAVAFLLKQQHDDGGWGESNDSYIPGCRRAAAPSTSWHTAWALLGLMVCGEVARDEVAAGIDWLVRHQREDGLWHDPWHNAPGFPRVFYLKYHGYSAYFPAWALNRYRQLCQRSLRAAS